MMRLKSVQRSEAFCAMFSTECSVVVPIDEDRSWSVQRRFLATGSFPHIHLVPTTNADDDSV
jgi:hypothetical protein